MENVKRFNKKEKAFIKNFALYGVGTTAAIKSGYSVKTAGQIAWNLLSKPKIKKAIEKEEKRIANKFDMSADEVLKQYQNLSKANISDYYEDVYYIRYTNDNTYVRLKKYKGNKITPLEYELLSDKHKAYYDISTELKPLKDLTKAQSAAIQKITYDKFGNPILHLSNKETSLDAIAKFHGIFEKDNKQKANKINVDNRSLNDFYNE